MEARVASAAKHGGGERRVAVSAPARADAVIDAMWLATLQGICARAAHELRGALNAVAVNLEVARSRSERHGVSGVVVDSVHAGRGEPARRCHRHDRSPDARGSRRAWNRGHRRGAHPGRGPARVRRLRRPGAQSSSTVPSAGSARPLRVVVRLGSRSVIAYWPRPTPRPMCAVSPMKRAIVRPFVSSMAATWLRSRRR